MILIGERVLDSAVTDALCENPGKIKIATATHSEICFNRILCIVMIRKASDLLFGLT